MKKFITMVVCFALVACVLTGCRRRDDKKTTDTTTTHSTITTHATTSSIAPTSEVTQPTSNTGIQDTPEASSMPNDGNGGMGGSTDNGEARSRAHYPSVIGRN